MAMCWTASRFHSQPVYDTDGKTYEIENEAGKGF